MLEYQNDVEVVGEITIETEYFLKHSKSKRPRSTRVYFVTI